MRSVVLGRRPYAEVEAAMRAFTKARTAATDDELWLVEHEPVFTQGIAGREAHVLAAGEVPVVRTDRGGQVTYHGPGQVVAYPLLDLRRRGYFVKEYVYRIEQAVIDVLAEFALTGHRVRTAPGVYVRLADPGGHAILTVGTEDAPDPLRGLGKIAALGIKVSNHCSYHGVALNVAMDLEPFQRINPCGYEGLATVDLATFGVRCTWHDAAHRLGENLARRL
ncbi:MAG: lipoyl(octanoyl) transferase LipB [Burkholderiales bacterium]|nr:lipoyl(octanoyl) transferase LipB [Burkholderiales bacterium]